MDQTTRFNYLVNCFKTGTATQAELEEFRHLLHKPDSKDSAEIDQSLKNLWTSVANNPDLLPDETSKRILDRIISPKIPSIPWQKNKRKVLYLGLTAAAAVLIFIFAGNRIFQTKPEPNITETAVASKKSVSQIVPGSTRAELILGDGSTVSLDSIQNGDIVSQENVSVKNINGRIVYTSGTGPASGKSLSYNTLRTPKGGFYQLTLSDGTKLWLNAASSLRYPVAFIGKERTVELNGEAYFEVAKDATRPFHVLVNGMNIEVLGTHFNVMAYDNEKSIKTTLLEGSVKIQGGESSAMLRPGQQARLEPGNRMEVLNNVNTDDVIAWKNGFFQLDRAGLDVLMRQIERWYDVDVVFEGAIQERTFGGKISRSKNIEDVFKILELSNVRFRIEDKKIIVSNKSR